MIEDKKISIDLLLTDISISKKQFIKILKLLNLDYSFNYINFNDLKLFFIYLDSKKKLSSRFINLKIKISFLFLLEKNKMLLFS